MSREKITERIPVSVEQYTFGLMIQGYSKKTTVPGFRSNSIDPAMLEGRVGQEARAYIAHMILKEMFSKYDDASEAKMRFVKPAEAGVAFYIDVEFYGIKKQEPEKQTTDSNDKGSESEAEDSGSEK